VLNSTQAALAFADRAEGYDTDLVAEVGGLALTVA
jgi:hypothetical protein